MSSKNKNKVLTPISQVMSLLTTPTREAKEIAMHTVILLDVPAENFLSESLYLTKKIKENDSNLNCSIVQIHEWSDKNLIKLRNDLQFKYENHFVIIPKGFNHREDEIQKFTSVVASQYFYVESTLPVEQIKISDLKLWKKSQYDVTSDQKIFVFGDVHESVEAWKEMNKKISPDVLQISLGDLFDKGSDTERTLDFAEEFIANGNKVIVGNHESYVARRLLGKIPAANVEADYFTSLAVFQENSNLAERFLAIYKQFLPFIRIKNDDKIFYLTHAPCAVEHLGKLNAHSLKQQRNFSFSSREPEHMKKELAFLNPPGGYDDLEPIHIFGHINHTSANILKGNKIWLDTSAVYGHKLTGLMMEYQKPMNEISVQAECKVHKRENLKFEMKK